MKQKGTLVRAGILAAFIIAFFAGGGLASVKQAVIPKTVQAQAAPICVTTGAVNVTVNLSPGLPDGFSASCNVSSQKSAFCQTCKRSDGSDPGYKSSDSCSIGGSGSRSSCTTDPIDCWCGDNYNRQYGGSFSVVCTIKDSTGRTVDVTSGGAQLKNPHGTSVSLRWNPPPAPPGGGPPPLVTPPPDNSCREGAHCTCGDQSKTPPDNRDPGHCDQCGGGWCNNYSCQCGGGGGGKPPEPPELTAECTADQKLLIKWNPVDTNIRRFFLRADNLADGRYAWSGGGCSRMHDDSGKLQPWEKFFLGYDFCMNQMPGNLREYKLQKYQNGAAYRIWIHQQGQSGWAGNARSIDANLNCAPVTPPVQPPVCVQPALSDPVCTIDGSSVTFAWQKGPVNAEMSTLQINDPRNDVAGGNWYVPGQDLWLDNLTGTSVTIPLANVPFRIIPGVEYFWSVVTHRKGDVPDPTIGYNKYLPYSGCASKAQTVKCYPPRITPTEPPVTPTLPPPQTCTSPTDVMIVIDRSRTMQDTVQGKKKMDWAKQSAESFINTISQSPAGKDGKVRVGVVSYGGRGNQEFDDKPPFGAAGPTKFNRGEPETRYEAVISANFAQVIADMQKNVQYRGSGTCHECGLWMANRVLQEPANLFKYGAYRPDAKKVVIFLSDGISRRLWDGSIPGPMRGDVSIPAEARTIKIASELKANNTKIYVVGFGVESTDPKKDQVQQEALKQVASNPSATYYRYAEEDASRWPAFFTEFAATVCVPDKTPTPQPTAPGGGKATSTPVPQPTVPQAIGQIQSFSQHYGDATTGNVPIQYVVSIDGYSIYKRTFVNGAWTAWTKRTNSAAEGTALPVNRFTYYARSVNPNGWPKEEVTTWDGVATYYRFYQNGAWGQWQSTVWTQIGVPNLTRGLSLTLSKNPAGQWKQDLLAAPGTVIYTRVLNGATWGAWSTVQVSALDIVYNGLPQSVVKSFNQTTAPNGELKQDFVTADGKAIFSRFYRNGGWQPFTLVSVQSLNIKP